MDAWSRLRYFPGLLSLLLLLCATILLPPSALRAEEEPVGRVQDLRYGVALYEFYQQSYFNALTELMAGQELQELPYHSRRAELLRGGISLSWGLDREAERIFSRLLQQELEPEQRDNAWFYLAKLKYQRADPRGAEQALDRIAMPRQFPHADETAFMRANMALRQGKFETARQFAAALPFDSPFLPYYYFNIGAMQTTQGDWQAGVNNLMQLHSLRLRSEESKNLRDRATTAAGFAYMAGDEPGLAMETFRQVRLNSLLVNQALLGYGWAAANSDEFREALGPWQRLRRGSLLDASVQESLMALPYAYERLHAYGSALIEYQNSSASLTQILEDTQRVIEAFRTQDIAALLRLDNNPAIDSLTQPEGVGQDWLRADSLQPVTDYDRYLAHLMSGDDFQIQVRELKELYQLSAYLRGAMDRLELLDAVVEQRGQVWREKIQHSAADDLAQNYRNLAESTETLQQRLNAARAQQDGILLLDRERLDLWRRVRNAQERLSALQVAGEDVSAEKQQLQRFRGMLLWQASEDYAAREWAMEKQLAELKQQMAAVEPLLKRVQGLQVNPEDFGYGPRITALRSRVESQRRKVDTRIASAEQQLREQAVAALQTQELRLRHYLGQTRLAIARLYDKGATDAKAATDAEAVIPASAEDSP